MALHGNAVNHTTNGASSGQVEVAPCAQTPPQYACEHCHVRINSVEGWFLARLMLAGQSIYACSHYLCRKETFSAQFPNSRQSRNRPIRRPQARLSVPILELITSSFQLACDPPRNPTMLRTPGGQTMICRSETASREGLLPDTRQLPTSILASRFQDSFLQRRLPIQHNREGYRSA